MKGGIYHRTPIDLTYHSRHIESNGLSKEQKRYFFEANTIGITDEAGNVDDVIEMTNFKKNTPHGSLSSRGELSS